MKTRPPFRPVALAALSAALWALPQLGCRQSVAEKASDSDSNGYVCSADHKFYTPRNVYADKCPVCATVELTEIYGFVCEVSPVIKPENFQPGCGAVTLARRNASKPVCQKCGKAVSAVMLPSGKQLQEWGGSPATRQQVLLRP